MPCVGYLGYLFSRSERSVRIIPLVFHITFLTRYAAKKCEAIQSSPS
jgi:hypothetical protein